MSDVATAQSAPSQTGRKGRLDGKMAVITGGASGIGETMVRRFAEEGAAILIADISGRQEEIAAAINAEFPSSGPAAARAVPFQCDVTKEDAVVEMIAAAEREFGRIDILCNNAGSGGHMRPLHEQTLEVWEELHSLNLKAAFFGMKHAVISMLKTGGGAIVNTTSAAGLVGWKHHSVYGAAKAGLNQLTKAAALDYSDKNIRINGVAPGTMFTQRNPAWREDGIPPADLPLLAGIPLARWGRGVDIANAALFLASDEAAYITGAILPVDGGYSIGFSGMGAERPGIDSLFKKD